MAAPQTTKKRALRPTGELAAELRFALSALMRRIRQEHGLPLHHGAVLGRLSREGPGCISGLAAAEHVRPQSMAQTVAELEAAGFVERFQDPADRRRQQITLTAKGRRLVARERKRREDWLAAALAHDLTAGETAALQRALPALRKLAESNVGPTRLRSKRG